MAAAWQQRVAGELLGHAGLSLSHANGECAEHSGRKQCPAGAWRGAGGCGVWCNSCAWPAAGPG